MCSYCTTNPRQLLNHVFTIHRHDPNFHIYCSYCMRSYKKLSAYHKHVSRGCTIPLAEDTITEQRSILQSSPELPEGDTCEAEQYSDPGVENQAGPAVYQQWHEAWFILSIKEQHVISQAAVDHVISSTTTLVSTILNNITADIHSTDPQELLKIIDQRVCDAKAVFSGLSTSYQQQKYFVDNFHLVVRHSVGICVFSTPRPQAPQSFSCVHWKDQWAWGKWKRRTRADTDTTK